MNGHLRANLLLLASTVVICCVLYPLVMYATGRALFPTAASGSLVNEKGEDATGAARVAADRPAVHVGRVLLAAAVGRVLQRDRERRQQLGREQPEVARPRVPAVGADRRVQEG